MDTRNLLPVGFWSESCRPEDAVDPAWGILERYLVMRYLRAGTITATYRGSSNCRICECFNGNCDVSDGTYVWPSGYVHYLELHDVKPPQAFIDHVMRKVVPS